MSGLNRGKIAAKIYNQLDKKGLLTEVTILRVGKNLFNEKSEDTFVCTIKGFYHKGNSYMEKDTEESTSFVKNNEEQFLVVFNDTSALIQENDYFNLNGINYLIVDKGNVHEIIYDMYLKRK